MKRFYPLIPKLNQSPSASPQTKEAPQVKKKHKWRELFNYEHYQDRVEEQDLF
jgi:hypothetical protein